MTFMFSNNDEFKLYFSGTFWGDPHFLTLDGKTFTFNGLGEYDLLKLETEDITFVLQGRTKQAVTVDGTVTDATIFSAFAARDTDGESFHAELNETKDGKLIDIVSYILFNGCNLKIYDSLYFEI